MRVGLIIFPTDKGIQPVELGREAEARGFDSLWFPEHSHIPVSRRSPWGGREGAPPLPEEYWRTHDQFIALAAIAGATEHIKLGTGITLVAQRDPIWLAKEIASLDTISGGRVLFGVGYGWNHEEMEAHGVDPKTRRRLVREKVLAMKELWTKDEAEFHGEFVDFGPAWQWPKPCQRPRIPTFIGGSPGPKMFAAVSEFADGWMPIGGGGIRESLPALHEAWAAAGRQGAPSVIPFGTVPSPRKLDYYREVGCTDVVVTLPSAGRDEVLGVLDTYQPMIG